MAKDYSGFQTEITMTTPATTPADGELLPCPFCGAGETVLHVNKGTWLGRGYGEPVSVEIRHWCPQEPGQPSRPILRIGRDESSAIAAWNRRATPSPGKAPEPVAWRHEMVEPTGQHLTLYSASGDNPWSHWLGQYRDECRYTATPLYASPGKAEAERWIPVDERLPSGQVHCLVCVCDPTYNFGYATIRTAWFEKQYYDTKINRFKTTGVVTHWMPLPEAPIFGTLKDNSLDAAIQQERDSKE